MAISPAKQAYLDECAQNYKFFSEDVLKIVDKKGRLIPFVWNEPQTQVWDVVRKGRKRVGCLKARQEGISTWIAGYFFWKVLFNPNERAVVLAHETEAAARIFSIYKNFYECMPGWMKEHFPLRHSTKTELVFKKHTGYVRIATANSPDKLRGTTVHYLHCSEMAFWDKAELVFTAAMQSLTDRGAAFVETTANSFNHFYSWWVSQNGYKKVFLPWMALHEYQLIETDDGLTDYEGVPIEFDDEIMTIINRQLEPEERAYVTQHKLTPAQTKWLKWALSQKCDDDWKRFSQEYPASAQEAFLHSGDMYFEGEWLPEEVTKTHDQMHKPMPGHVYVVGVDAATGSANGDFSAAMVMDVTNKQRIKPVAWFYGRVPVHQFAQTVQQMGRKYNDALIVCEVNHVGAAVQEELSIDQYPKLYRRFVYDKMAAKYVEKLGFYTSKANRAILLNRLRKLISTDVIVEVPQVLINEIGSFVYNDKGEPYASPGCHDDMIFASALCLEGLDQVQVVREEVIKNFAPRNATDVVAFERTTGMDAFTGEQLDELANARKYDEPRGWLFNDGLD